MELRGKYNQSITVTKKINSSKKEVWNHISSPAYLNLSHPFCKENKVISWEDNNRSDILIYLNGLVYIRNFTNWKENKGYTLFIGEKNKSKSKIVWKISNKNKEILLSITVFPYFMRKYPKFISHIPYLIYIKPKLINYLESVLKGIDWHLKEKRSVPRNKFGRHSWFS